MLNSGGRGGYERDMDILVEEKVEGVAEEEEEKEDEVIAGAAATVAEVLVEGEEERKVWDMQNPYETYLSKLDGEEGRSSLTIDDLCISIIAPPLMEKIRDDLIGDKIQINKQTSDEWRLVPVSNPNSVSAHRVVLIRRTRSRTVSNHMQLEKSTVRTFHVHSDDHLPSLPDLIKQLPKLLSEKMLLDEISLKNAVRDQDYWRIITR